MEGGVLLDGIPETGVITARKGAILGVLGPILGHLVTVRWQGRVHQLEWICPLVLPVLFQKII